MGTFACRFKTLATEPIFQRQAPHVDSFGIQKKGLLSTIG